MLMMMPDRGDHVGVADAGDHPSSNNGVLFDHDALFDRERSVFPKDAIGHADLSHVVQGRGLAYIFDIRGSQTHGRGGSIGVTFDALRVAVCVGVFGLQRAGQVLQYLQLFFRADANVVDGLSRRVESQEAGAFDQLFLGASTLEPARDHQVTEADERGIGTAHPRCGASHDGPKSSAHTNGGDHEHRRVGIGQGQQRHDDGDRKQNHERGVAQGLAQIRPDAGVPVPVLAHPGVSSLNTTCVWLTTLSDYTLGSEILPCLGYFW